MRKIVYYVAITLDGYICGPNESIEGYVDQGSGLKKYQSDLESFDTVIMGRKTYEFGFKFGLIPGQPAYKHMRHYIFSETANYENLHDQVKVLPRNIDLVSQLKEETGSSIYLCGGSIFAGWLLNHSLIDEVKVKVSPVIFGDGLPMFSGVERLFHLKLIDSQRHDHGMMINTYTVNY
jgi:dihydrofolate reductase